MLATVFTTRWGTFEKEALSRIVSEFPAVGVWRLQLQSWDTSLHRAVSEENLIGSSSVKCPLLVQLSVAKGQGGRVELYKHGCQDSVLWESWVGQMSNLGHLLDYFFQVGKLWNVRCHGLASDFERETSRSFDLIQNFSNRVLGHQCQWGYLKGFCGQVCLGSGSLNNVMQTSFLQDFLDNMFLCIMNLQGRKNRRSNISQTCMTTKLGISKNSQLCKRLLL